MSLPLACLTSALALTTGQAWAEMNFNRIVSFPVIRNTEDGANTTRETSPEIIVATADSMTLVYTDSPPGSTLPLVRKEEVRALLPDLTASGGNVLDRIEDLAILSSGEAMLWLIGPVTGGN